MKPSLNGIDLTPRSETIVDLAHREAVETWCDYGSNCASYVKDWTPEKGAAFKSADEEAEKIVKKQTKTELVNFLTAHGVGNVYSVEKKRSLVSRVMIFIHDKWSPRTFINAAPLIFVCSCGFEGPPAGYVEGSGTKSFMCGARCGRPSYAMQLKAKRDYYAKKVG